MPKAKQVLVVDDQVGIRILISEVIAQLDYHVRTAASGAEALALLSQYQPDLVLLDMNMPGLSGLETLQQLRQAYPALPVLMITADEHDQNMNQTAQLGISGRINKPFDLDELCRQVQLATR